MTEECGDEQGQEDEAPYCLWSGEFDASDPYCLRECDYRIECLQIQEKNDGNPDEPA